MCQEDQKTVETSMSVQTSKANFLLIVAMSTAMLQSTSLHVIFFQCTLYKAKPQSYTQCLIASHEHLQVEFSKNTKCWTRSVGPSIQSLCAEFPGISVFHPENCSRV